MTVNGLTDDRFRRLRAGADDAVTEEPQDNADEWTWESYTPGSSEEEMVLVIEKKKKKGKDKDKEKDKKKEVESIADTTAASTIAPPAGFNCDRARFKAKGKKAKKISPEVLAEMARQAELEAKQAEEEARMRERMEEASAAWEQYQKCDGLPDPYNCGQMNTYLSVWEDMIEDTTMDDAAVRTIEVLKLVNDLTDFIEYDYYRIVYYSQVRRSFRQDQQKSLNVACYRILKDVSNRMIRLNLEKSDYRRVEPNFTVCLWTMVELPTSLPNPRAPHRQRTELNFSELNLHLVLPLVINCYRLAIRLMYLSYDHLSDLCATYDEPPMPENHQLDICKVVREEWYTKRIFKYEEYRRLKRKQGEKIEPQEYSRETGVMPEVPYIKMPESPSTHVINEEAETYRQIRESLITVVANDVINLRKYVILGGIFFLNLFFQPPQPHYCVSMEINLSRMFIPKTLKDVRFCAPYKPVPPPTPDQKLTAAELEAQAKKQEAELDKLIFVSWNEVERVWSTAEVHDFRYLEESATVTFRLSRFGVFSFAMNRFTNLPYQTWEMKPELNGTVTIQLVAAILTIDFNIKENKIAMMKVQNAPNKALKNHIGKYHNLPKLKRLLLETGIDVFPFFDTFCYVENSCEKHWQMEKHLYFQMAQVSACYNFSWSRWNTIAGCRSVIMQMREFKLGKTKQPNFNMLQVTPLKAEFISCSEVSSEFFPEAIEGMAFYSDLYTLVKGIGSIVVRNKIQNTSSLLVGTVAELLQSMRILSFS
ncbi:hypothetical protein RN001_011077 [Aquatica leii]|uniref:Axonemal 84 kDa protein n=1 Tax=Aquatica leii TaxID=1421715 RepID=A0AAN7PAV0_9COLE|nr:hypothetical protein RN001_011077 [Aquatica leii]